MSQIVGKAESSVRQSMVVDASVVVTALLQSDDLGGRAASCLLSNVVAPALLPFEAASAIRRQERNRLIDAPVAEDAIRIAASLRFERADFGPLAPRIWELRSNVSAYDASYVALAEMTGLPLVTLDRKLAHAPGVRCEIVVLA